MAPSLDEDAGCGHSVTFSQLDDLQALQLLKVQQQGSTMTSLLADTDIRVAGISSKVVPTITHATTCRLQTPWAEFLLHGFEEVATGKEHLALTLGQPIGDEPVLLRMHSECLTGDALFSQRCDCGAQLRVALERIGRRGSGVLVYLRQEGRSIGLLNKLRAYELQDRGADTVEANHSLGFRADLRNYSVGAAILFSLGIRSVELMTNNPDKVRALEALGVCIAKRVPLRVGQNRHNRHYLQTKADRLGHWL